MYLIKIEMLFLNQINWTSRNFHIKMCQTSQKVQDLEDLFKDDELNDVSSICETTVFNYIRYLEDYVSEHIRQEPEKYNSRLVVNKLKKKFPNYLQKCTHRCKQQYKKTMLLFYYKKFVLLKKIHENKEANTIIVQKRTENKLLMISYIFKIVLEFSKTILNIFKQSIDISNMFSEMP